MIALTTLPSVKAWLRLTTSVDDALLTALIGRVSAVVLSYLNRQTLAVATFNETYDGWGGASLALRQGPVIAVQSVAFFGRTLGPAAAHGPGFVFTPGSPKLSLKGERFPRAPSAVEVVYQAGYQTSETVTVAQAAATPGFTWLADGGVAYAGGPSLTLVAANPAQGQYTVSGGVYGFNAADNGASIILTYSYTPPAIEQAVIELVGEAYIRRTHIGESSRSLGGQETASYAQVDMGPAAKAALAPYRQPV